VSADNQKLDRHSKDKLSEVFLNLAHQCEHNPELMSLGELLDRLNARGHFLVCLVFASPFLLPIPLPGLSTAFGFVTLIAAAQIVLNSEPWIPRAWEAKKLPRSTAQLFASFARILTKIEHLFKARLIAMCQMKWLQRFNGLNLIVLSLLLGLPMPPGFNAPPAFAICILSIAALEEDGVAMILAWLLTVLNVILFSIFFYVGWESVETLFFKN